MWVQTRGDARKIHTFKDLDFEHLSTENKKRLMMALLDSNVVAESLKPLLSVNLWAIHHFGPMDKFPFTSIPQGFHP